ncbi:MAG: hypothetical protein K6F77_02445, partial [Lachnospiraceae bacterium]|nr:hypothetical protein [Lachnospiraceae bacterium]
LNCIAADLRRVLRKKTFIIMLVIVALLNIGAAIPAVLAHGAEESSAKFALIIGALNQFTGIFIGIPVFLAVFSDDFKSRAMQTAIGFGLSRAKLIVCRFLEVVLLIAECYVVLSIVVFVMKIIAGADMNAFTGIMKNLWLTEIEVLCHCSVCMIIVYIMQNAVLALVSFILLMSGFLDGIVMAIEMIPFLKEHNIKPSCLFANYSLSEAVSGKAYFWPIVFVAYIIVPIIITMIVFRKKELEF